MRAKNAEEGLVDPNDLQLGPNQIKQIKLLRWRAWLHKIKRALGFYTPPYLDTKERHETVTACIECFVQLIEHHPNVLANDAIG